jgi:hypothetical protein
MDADLMTSVSAASTRKRKGPPPSSFDTPIQPSKRQATGSGALVIDIDDDGDDDDDEDEDTSYDDDYDWFTHLSDTGYQDSYASGFGNGPSAMFSETLGDDTESRYSITQGYVV